MFLGMFFLTLSEAKVRFASKKLVRRSYTAKDAIPTTTQIEIIDKKKFVVAAMDPQNKIFMVHVSSVISSKQTSRKALISSLDVANNEPIYSLKQVNLEHLKTCVNANLTNGFIRLWKL